MNQLSNMFNFSSLAPIKIIIFLILFCCNLSTDILAQNTENKSADLAKKENNLLSFFFRPQHEHQLKRPYYIGATLQGVQFGYHYNKFLSFNLSYTPKNEFRKANGLELGGISEGLGFTDGANDNTIFDITGVEDYHNLDRHLLIADVRLFPIPALPIFLSAGYGLATKSERTVFFTQETRTIGANQYEDLGIDVQVKLQDAHSINIGAGFHHFFGPVGLGFSGVFGLQPRKLNSINITSNQTIMANDKTALESIIQQEVSREHYGFYQFLVSASFRFPKKDLTEKEILSLFHLK